MKAKVALVATKGPARDAYQASLQSQNVQISIFDSLKQLYEMLILSPHNGILVDIETLIKSPKSERDLIHDILEIFPVTRLQYNKSTQEILLLYYGQARGHLTLENFIAHDCHNFQARTIRSSGRKDISFNVLLCKSEKFNDRDLVKTVTINVSEGGCFLYSTDPMKAETRISFTIEDIYDKTPILGEVRWSVPWGQKVQFPGMGVRFLDIRTGQLEELKRKYFI